MGIAECVAGGALLGGGSPIWLSRVDQVRDNLNLTAAVRTSAFEFVCGCLAVAQESGRHFEHLRLPGGFV